MRFSWQKVSSFLIGLRVRRGSFTLRRLLAVTILILFISVFYLIRSDQEVGDTLGSRPQFMTYIEYEYVDPNLPSQLKYSPRIFKLWMADDRLLNLLESPDFITGIQAQFILGSSEDIGTSKSPILPESLRLTAGSEPILDSWNLIGWSINLFNRLGKQGLYSKDTFGVATRVFPKINLDFLKNLKFGKEEQFFIDHGAAPEKNDGELGLIYNLSKEEVQLKLSLAPLRSDIVSSPQQRLIPKALEIAWAGRRTKIIYRNYLPELEFDPERFKPSKDLRIVENKQQSAIPENNRQNEQRKVKRLIEETRYLLTHYYEKADPTRLRGIISLIDKFGKRLGVDNWVYLFSAIFEKHPELIDKIVDEGLEASPELQLLIHRALQVCNLPVCKDLLKSNPFSFRGDINEEFSKVVWPPPTKLEILSKDSPSQLWSNFYITGDRQILELIFEIAEGNGSRLGEGPNIRPSAIVRTVFRESMMEHAKDHASVAAFLSKKRGRVAASPK